MLRKIRWAGVVAALALFAWASPAEAKGKPEHANGNANGSKHSQQQQPQQQPQARPQQYEPDPVQQQTPPATKGPTQCPSYDDGNAGPYDHDNCDGSQALHGGDGNGKCAGCTGKADDKWPAGQNVGDHNNGYECDNNMGVGRGNPAHSRCASATITCPPGSPGCSPPPVCPPDRACEPPRGGGRLPVVTRASATLPVAGAEWPFVLPAVGGLSAYWLTRRRSQ